MNIIPRRFLEKNKWFTLIEVLLVIVIISIVGGIGLRYFSSGNFSKQQNIGIECGSSIKTKLQQFIDLARKSWGLWREYNNRSNIKNKNYPDFYGIKFNKDNNEILQYYKTGFKNNQENPYGSNLLSGIKCNTSSQYIPKLLFSWSINSNRIIKLEMNKWFSSNKAGSMKSFQLLDSENNTINTTGYILLQSCKKDYCIDAYKFYVNIPTQKLEIQQCRSYFIEENRDKYRCRKRR